MNQVRARLGLRLNTRAKGDSAVRVSGSRAPRAADRRGLAVLMLDAYRGTIDDHDETLDDAIAEVDRLLAGDYGRLLPECSRVVERRGRLASACLMTLHGGTPFLAFSMTEPQWKRRGLARALLQECLDLLEAAGYDEVRLVVTAGNEPAEMLYRSVGFAEVP